MDIVPQLIANSIVAGSVYTILALGFNLIFSTGKFIDMGYGVLVAVGGYGVFFFSHKLGVPLVLGIPVALLISGLASFCAYRLVYRPLRSRKASSAVLLMSSLGVLFFAQAVLAIIFTSQFQGLSGLLSANPTLELWGGTMTELQVITVGIALVLTLASVLFLKGSRFGKAITAISDDEEVSKIIGIDTDKLIGRVFFIGGIIGGLGGVLIGLDTGIEPAMALPWFLATASAAIIGGIGNIYAGIAGSFFIAFAENFGIWKIAGEWKIAIVFAVLLVFLTWKPKGLFPR
ncbi:MAG: branched-chain amino acid ABC transporter permease [bacterium]|nr:branched-chain amino acid ABC transporter permease [bacterium]